jgi:glycosyltransferase involved in cell wall biosynthesis
MPKVSVIIPTYNRSDYLMEAIESVRQQTYTDYEIIVVDDGSTDDTRGLLKPLRDNGTIHYIYQENQNKSAARNHGVRQAKGEYIAFLDSDDLFVPTKLEKQVAYLDEHPEVGFVHSWYSKFDDAGNHLGTRDTSKYTGWIYPDILLSWSILMATPCMMMRVEVFEDVGGFDVSQHWGEDIDIWRRITQRYPIGLVPEVLTKVRVHPGNLSKSKAKPIVWFEDYLKKTFRDDPDLPLKFRRKVTAALYTNVALNQLEKQSPDIVRQIRALCFKAIFNWPLLPGAYIGLAASLIPTGLRMILLENFRNWRNPIENEP